MEHADVAAVAYAFHPNNPTSDRAEAQRPIEIDPKVATFLRIMQRVGRQTDRNGHVDRCVYAVAFSMKSARTFDDSKYSRAISCAAFECR